MPQATNTISRADELRNKREQLMQERGYPKPETITDIPFRYEDRRGDGRPTTLPQQRSSISSTSSYQPAKKFPLVQIVIPYQVHDSKQIIIPVPTDYYYNPSDRKGIKHISDWQTSHSSLEVISIDYGGKQYRGKELTDIVDTFNQSTAELERYIDLVQDGQLYSEPKEIEKTIYVDRFPFRLVLLNWALMGIIVYLITLLFMSVMR